MNIKNEHKVDVSSRGAQRRGDLMITWVAILNAHNDVRGMNVDI